MLFLKRSYFTESRENKMGNIVADVLQKNRKKQNKTKKEEKSKAENPRR